MYFWIKHLKPWPSKHCDPAGALWAFIRGSYQDMSMTKLQTINELYTHHTISYQCSHTCIHYIQNQQNTKSSITIIDLLVLFVVWQYLRNILINRTEAWFDACERMWKKSTWSPTAAVNLTWPTFLSRWSICHTSDHIGHRVLTRRPGLFCPVAWKTRTSCRSLLPSSEDSMKMWGIFSRIYWDLPQQMEVS